MNFCRSSSKKSKKLTPKPTMARRLLKSSAFVRGWRAAFFVALLTTFALPVYSTDAKIAYPFATIVSVQEVYFGTPVQDPYRWLENGKSPAVQAWVKAQDELARAYLLSAPGRSQLQTRLRSLIYVDATSLPRRGGTRLFYARSFANKEKPIFYWQEQNGVEHELLDPMDLQAAGRVSIGEWIPSPDGSYFAYQRKDNNADEAVIHIRKVADGSEQVRDVIPGANFADLSWSADSRGFYYMGLPMNSDIPETERVAHAEIKFHRLGTDAGADAVVYPKTGDSSLYLSPSMSRDGRWLFVAVMNGWSSTDVHVRDEQKKGAFQPVFNSTTSTAAITAWKDHFYIYTNDAAPRYRVVKVSPTNLQRASWKTIVPERPDTTIAAMRIIGGHLCLIILKDAVSQLEVRTLKGALLKKVRLPSLGKVSDISGREDRDDMYFEFESFTVPRRVYRYSMSSGKVTEWAKTALELDSSAYHIEQVWYPSKDGTPISMFIVGRKDRMRGQPAPLLLQGYGGFSEPMLPQFNALIYPWVEAGGLFALPNLRGGGEYGESWHQAGSLLQKQNTFDDFIAAGEYLISKGYTRKELLAIQGVSNGGLLVGAVLTQRPDLFRAAVCKVPLLDMIRYPLFGEGPAWISEYGSPKNEEQFRALWAYSPYHQVKPGTAYPATLLLSAQNDDRVDPMHARKMTAALQAANSSNHPILLSIQQNAGHGGAGMKQALVAEYVDRLSFLMKELKMTYPIHP
jgi:prolyl oligopeptidase